MTAMRRLTLMWLVTFLVYNGANGLDQPNFFIGTGRADITGPAAEINMMGYANPKQDTQGIHFRLYSRAFIIADHANSHRVVYVSADIAMVSQIIKIEVVKKLKTHYGDIYTEMNVCLSSIHTHSGPGGFLQYLLYDITSLGFVAESTDAIVNGIVKSIQIAHERLVPGDIFINRGTLLDSNINRSPTAYLNNPQEERDRYQYDVDKDMVVLKMVNSTGAAIGMISWFAVHCTSMNNTNHLISGDNKGYASYLFEQHMNPGSLPGEGDFVAAFAQANEGDVSPNTRGPHCLDTGLPCHMNTSTCNGKSELCVAFGPGVDMADSTRIIGNNQFIKALNLYNNATRKLSGPVDFKHQNVDMTNVQVNLSDGSQAHTCKPAMGYSFAAGTTDGPGAMDFTQGTTQGNALWNLIRNFIKKPSAEQTACQLPKPILLDTGEISYPYSWQPDIVELQLLRVGDFIIVAVPGEFSTMSGRRVRSNVTATLAQHGFPETTETVIAGLSNTYSSYITTFEEYQVQRYEGASTIYGPHTLQAYIQHFNVLAAAIAQNSTVDKGPSVPYLRDKQLCFVLPVVYDGSGIGKSFGDVLTDAKPKYVVNTTVSVSFVAGHPRNNLMTGATFLTVEWWNPEQSTWHVAYTDSSWETRFKWTRTSSLLGKSQATVEWDIPAAAMPGVYRMRHFGHEKSVTGDIHPYAGTSASFIVETMEEASPRGIEGPRADTFYQHVGLHAQAPHPSLSMAEILKRIKLNKTVLKDKLRQIRQAD
ncbi:PREDICTED: neutral ceramidase-like [Priapulus caudatus]|uniref:Neutral ceramidase n=1 Tax=Priapulus caudatus TaxID=37621 RepID=A0ABM1F6E6_PRICU|nr:PREDICTED: neutral ceramidase-like [Priapulus caudatus]